MSLERVCNRGARTVARAGRGCQTRICQNVQKFHEKRSSVQGSRGRHVQIGFDFTFFQVVAGLLGGFTPIATTLDSIDPALVLPELGQEIG